MKILSFILKFTCSILAFCCSITVNATVKQENNMNIIILFNKNQIDSHVKKIISESGGKVIKEIPMLGGMEVECTPEIIPKIKSQDSVESLSPSRTIKIKENKTINSNNYYEDKGSTYYEDNGSSYYEDNNSNLDNSEDDKEDIFSGNLYEKYQWDIKRITNNGKSFDIESGNHNTIVAIIDSGVDTDHQDLKNNFLGGKNFIPKDFNGDDTETGDMNDVEDRFGHGTRVAGQIAANGRIKGIAPNIGFKSYRVFNKNGETTASICADAIINAVTDGTKVINLSFGGYYLDGKCIWTDCKTGKEYDLGDNMADYSLLERAIKFALKNNVIVVSAAGNEGLDCSDNEKLAEYFTDLYKEQGFRYNGAMYEEPGSFEGVINVSAIDKQNKIAPYSNYGQGFIDITAPSGVIMGKFDIKDLCLTTSMNDGYCFDTGTSYSAPKAAAVAALLISRNNNIKYDEVVQKLYNNADKLTESKYYGSGILNAYNSLK